MRVWSVRSCRLPATLLLLLPLLLPLTTAVGLRSTPSAQQPLVIHEASDFIVVNKPPRVVVHDGEASLTSTLAAMGHADVDPCHRLDADTSGVLLFARKGATGRLHKCLAAQNTKKCYRAILQGSFKGSSGAWTQAISAKAEGRKNPRGVAASRVDAVTEYNVLGQTQFITAVDFVLRSGRKHQIRKHAACNKHPIIGDTRYGPKHGADVTKRYEFDGMALHSALLAITIDGTDHVFEAPLPSSWDGLLKEFGELPASRLWGEHVRTIPQE